eukprot:scaffold325329_cov53-Tisochrysis_lutea.AAC.1
MGECEGFGFLMGDHPHPRGASWHPLRYLHRTPLPVSHGRPWLEARVLENCRLRPLAFPSRTPC